MRSKRCAVQNQGITLRWTLTTSAIVVRQVQTWTAWDRIFQMMVQVIFCQTSQSTLLSVESNVSYFFYFR